MKIKDDVDPLPERRYASLMQRLVLRNPAEDETGRLPLSRIAFWNEPAKPELETLRIWLDRLDKLDDDD